MIVIQVKGLNEAVKGLSSSGKRIGNAIGDGVQNWGHNLQENMRIASLYGKGGKKPHFWSGEVYQGIKWNKRKLDGYLTMSDEGIYLDRAKPHWVALKRGRKVTVWAVEKGIAKPRKYGGADTSIYPFATRSLFVRPHPFIDNALRREVPKLDGFIKRELKNVKKA